MKSWRQYLLFFLLLSANTMANQIVEIRFNQLPINKAKKAAQLHLTTLSCQDNRIFTKTSYWNCHKKKQADICQAVFECQKLPEDTSIKNYKLQVQKLLTKENHLLKEITISIKKPIKQNVMTSSHKKINNKKINNYKKSDQLSLKRIALAAVQLNDPNNKSALTTNLSWLPLWQIKQNIKLLAQLGGQFISSAEQDSILILDMGVGASYNIRNYELSLMTGSQVWNDQERSVYDYLKVGLGYNFTKAPLSFLDNIFLSYQSTLDQELTEIRAGLVFSFF